MPERFPPIAPSERTPEQAAVCQLYGSGWRSGLGAADGRLGGPLDATLRSPELAIRLARMSDYFRSESSLSPALAEFVILFTASRCRSDYAWSVHCPWALEAGVPLAVVKDLAHDRSPRGMTSEQDAAYALLDELCRSHSISSATFERAKEVFSERQLVDLVGLFSYYRSTAAFLALADVSAPRAPAAPLATQSHKES